MRLVLPVFTPNSRLSPWVNAEIGAAWIGGKSTVPLLTGSMRWEDVSGPIFARARPVLLYDTDQLRELLASIPGLIGWTEKVVPGTKGAHEYEAALNTLIEQATSSAVFFPPERLLMRRDLFSEQQKLRWKDISETARHDVYIWGWSCANTVSPNNKRFFTKIVERVERLNFLILDQTAAAGAAQYMNLGIVCDRPTAEITMDIENARSTINAQLVHDLPDELKSRVVIRTTNWFMSWSGVAIDPDTDEGMMQVEFYNYGNPTHAHNHLESRPNLVLTRRSPFYESFWGSLKAMWGPP